MARGAGAGRTARRIIRDSATATSSPAVLGISQLRSRCRFRSSRPSRGRRVSTAPQNWPRSTFARLQNVYGPGQSLINSYTGVVSLFAQLARSKRSIPLYEDGLMQRDFVYIDDGADALLAAVDRGQTGALRIDVGSGRVTTIRQVAEFMADRYGAPEPHLSGAYRHGDVRHAGCDISATLRRLDWTPRWPLEKGLEALCQWIDARFASGARATR
jgi:dTDP-L-rhamnose 4-epimerase